jgi:hypothetical protein
MLRPIGIDDQTLHAAKRLGFDRRLDAENQFQEHDLSAVPSAHLWSAIYASLRRVPGRKPGLHRKPPLTRTKRSDTTASSFRQKLVVVQRVLACLDWSGSSIGMDNVGEQRRQDGHGMIRWSRPGEHRQRALATARLGPELGQFAAIDLRHAASFGVASQSALHTCRASKRASFRERVPVRVHARIKGPRPA